ncbi:MAG: type II toxin-antitoxin system prevent-host-death family antitoxin [Chloroflexota bacterium]
MLKTTERIITLADLQQDTDAALRNAQKQPLIITAGGRPAAYLLSVEMFDVLVEYLLETNQQDLARNVAEAEKQFDRGDYVNLADAIAIAEAAWQTQEVLA